MIAGLADAIDYDNFKAALARHEGTAERSCKHALHDVWATMLRLQP